MTGGEGEGEGEGERGRRPRRGGGGRIEDALDLFARDDAPPEPVPDDAAPGETAATAVSVSLLTQTIKDVVEGAFIPIWVRGEVSDFKSHRSGHWYFALRDGASQMRCVVWSRDQRRIPAPPDDGMQLRVLGRPAVYAARGELQFTVQAIEAEGDGLWRKALERTRRRLESDGLLARERKRAIPRFPRRVAVITSPDGAALHDIMSVIRRRCASVEIVVVPARVQGDGAPDSLCSALARVARWNGCDTLIVGRGGGSREDLWAFNDERVARALAACPMPTISAVGHEVDITICDLVADLRAATPSAAAEAAVPLREAMRVEVRTLAVRLSEAANRRVSRARQRAAEVTRQLSAAASRGMERRRARVEGTAGRLHALSPLATLARGYAVARADSGRTLTSVDSFEKGSAFHLLLRDGRVHARTESVSRDSAPPPASDEP